MKFLKSYYYQNHLLMVRVASCISPFKCYFAGNKMSQHVSPFQFVGGAPCLDFVNTVGFHTGNPSEKLKEFGDLVRWAHEAEIIDQSVVDELHAFSETCPKEASKILERARAFRRTLFRLFDTRQKNESPKEVDLTALNETLRAYPMRLKVSLQGVDCSCQRESGPTNDARLLGPVAWSAAELLASDQIRLVRQCASATCGWFFVDTTKNHSRRWCMMSDCGSHAKAKRYYQRKKSKSSRSQLE